jgi:hypothetical protein
VGSGWRGGRVCTRWVGLCVIAKKAKIYPHLRVVKILIHKMIPKAQTNLNLCTVQFIEGTGQSQNTAVLWPNGLRLLIYWFDNIFRPFKLGYHQV